MGLFSGINLGRASPPGRHRLLPGKGKKAEVLVRINVPSYGRLFMTGTRLTGEYNIYTSASPAMSARELSGEVEIEVPFGTGRRRVRAIRVCLRSVSRLNMGPGRGWEKDVLFQRTVELKGAMVLEEGVQRYKFTIIVPFSLPPYDVHPHGDVRGDIHAEVIGLSGADELSGIKALALTDDELDSPPGSDIVPDMRVSWSDPVAANGVGGDEIVPWLKESVRASRCVGMMYNPNADNEVNTLDDICRSVVDGLGPFSIRFLSNVWCIGSLLKTVINIPNPSPATTVYYVALLLEQTTEVKSPRDPEDTPPIKVMTPFTIWEAGKIPPKNNLTPKTAALWRGTAAGGTDEGEINFNDHGRMPNDLKGRPSTVEGINTPIRVSHRLALKVWYTVAHEDPVGNPLAKGEYMYDTGVLRIMQYHHSVVVPSCCLIPEALALPQYNDVKCDDGPPCAICGTLPQDQACSTCELTHVRHARHDHDPTLVGNANGTCPDCDKRFVTQDADDHCWADCACGFSCLHLEKRMLSAIPDEAVQVLARAATPPPLKTEYVCPVSGRIMS